MQRQTLALGLCILVVNCNGSSMNTCEPEVLLRKIGQSISTGNAETLRSSILTFGDVKALRDGSGNTSSTGDEGRDFDAALRDEVARDLQRWNSAVGSRPLTGVKLGQRHRGSLSVMVDGVEILGNSILTFAEGDAQLSVAVEKLVNVDGCWKVAELGDPERSTLGSEDSRDRIESKSCPSKPEDLLVALAKGLVGPAPDVLWSVSDDDIKKLKGDAKGFDGFGESSRFFLESDIENWAPLLEKSTVVRVQPGPKIVTEWRGIPNVETIDNSAILFARDSIDFSVPVDRLINVGGCWRVDRLGTPTK